MIRVLLVDDLELVRDGFRLILDLEPDIEVVGETGNGRDAVAMATRLQPDVVVMDIRMPVMDGVAATRAITSSGLASRVLALTTFDLDEHVYEAMRAGASGFLLKDAPRDLLTSGIRTVARGEAMLAPAITRRLVERFASLPSPAGGVPAPMRGLSDRELEVLRLIARGLSNTEISETLVVSPATVKTHVARVLAKLDLRDRVQAVVLAYETGFVQPGALESRNTP